MALKLDKRRAETLVEFMEREIWPAVPQRVLGKRVGKREVERLLGYGRNGA